MQFFLSTKSLNNKAILTSLLMASHALMPSQATATDNHLPLIPSHILQSTEEDFQQDADIIRLQHLKYWVTQIEDYQQKTGHYPFQGQADVPIYVFVATPQQQKYITQAPPPPAKTYSMKNFVDTLEAGLGHQIDEFYDPQYAPDVKPNFYMYMVDGDNYYFAVHTHQQYPFSKIIGRNYNKIEVSNIYNNSANLVLLSNQLFPSPSFNQAVTMPIKKEGFFRQRENKTLHISQESNQ
ncbi:hypothetical protein [Psychrobacter sp. I-STPA6b]|uniref:hypothetical protein n=1 Tax=Psychrobacter sp. I-STPA6b TaxID=2585718 RepID=UPI001D0CA9F6|nr:hypothetical protein [Psychrobacter sp. I-STPA6b]